MYCVFIYIPSYIKRGDADIHNGPESPGSRSYHFSRKKEKKGRMYVCIIDMCKQLMSKSEKDKRASTII